jgi:hypothetical protein
MRFKGSIATKSRAGLLGCPAAKTASTGVRSESPSTASGAVFEAGGWQTSPTRSGMVHMLRKHLETIRVEHQTSSDSSPVDSAID